jgi:hypothetical protein
VLFAQLALSDAKYLELHGLYTERKTIFKVPSTPLSQGIQVGQVIESKQTSEHKACLLANWEIISTCYTGHHLDQAETKRFVDTYLKYSRPPGFEHKNEAQRQRIVNDNIDIVRTLCYDYDVVVLHNLLYEACLSLGLKQSRTQYEYLRYVVIRILSETRDDSRREATIDPETNEIVTMSDEQAEQSVQRARRFTGDLTIRFTGVRTEDGRVTAQPSIGFTVTRLVRQGEEQLRIRITELETIANELERTSVVFNIKSEFFSQTARKIDTSRISCRATSTPDGRVRYELCDSVVGGRIPFQNKSLFVLLELFASTFSISQENPQWVSVTTVALLSESELARAYSQRMRLRVSEIRSMLTVMRDSLDSSEARSSLQQATNLRALLSTSIAPGLLGLISSERQQEERKIQSSSSPASALAANVLPDTAMPDSTSSSASSSSAVVVSDPVVTVRVPSDRDMAEHRNTVAVVQNPATIQQQLTALSTAESMPHPVVISPVVHMTLSVVSVPAATNRDNVTQSSSDDATSQHRVLTVVDTSDSVSLAPVITTVEHPVVASAMLDDQKAKAAVTEWINASDETAKSSHIASANISLVTSPADEKASASDVKMAIDPRATRADVPLIVSVPVEVRVNQLVPKRKLQTQPSVANENEGGEQEQSNKKPPSQPTNLSSLLHVVSDVDLEQKTLPVSSSNEPLALSIEDQAGLPPEKDDDSDEEEEEDEFGEDEQLDEKEVDTRDILAEGQQRKSKLRALQNAELLVGVDEESKAVIQQLQSEDADAELEAEDEEDDEDYDPDNDDEESGEGDEEDDVDESKVVDVEQQRFSRSRAICSTSCRARSALAPGVRGWTPASSTSTSRLSSPPKPS